MPLIKEPMPPIRAPMAGIKSFSRVTLVHFVGQGNKIVICFLCDKRFLFINSDLGYMVQNVFLPLITPIIKPMIGNKKTIFPLPTDIKGSVLLIKKLIEEAKFNAVIDRKYPLDQIVEAYKYVEKGKRACSHNCGA